MTTGSYVNTAEGGPSGSTVTVANSGGTSGDPWSNVTISGAGFTYSTARAYQGSQSYRGVTNGPAVAGASPEGTGQWYMRTEDATSAGAPIHRLRFYIYMTAYPSQTVQFIQPIARDGTIAGYIYLAGDGRLQIVNQDEVVARSTTNAVPLNKWVRIETIWDPHTATTGVARCLYAIGDGPAVETIVDDVGKFGTATLRYFAFGKVGNNGTWAATHIDNVAGDYGTAPDNATFLGPSSLNRFKAGASSLDLRLGSTRPTAVWAGSTQLWP